MFCLCFQIIFVWSRYRFIIYKCCICYCCTLDNKYKCPALTMFSRSLGRSLFVRVFCLLTECHVLGRLYSCRAIIITNTCNAHQQIHTSHYTDAEHFEKRNAFVLLIHLLYKWMRSDVKQQIYGWMCRCCSFICIRNEHNTEHWRLLPHTGITDDDDDDDANMFKWSWLQPMNEWN